MKKKIFLMLAVMAMLACVFAISVSATDWTYKDENNQTYLTLTIDDETGVVTEYNGKFPMWTENNEPLTWYVIKTEGNVKIVKSFISTDPVYTNHGNGYFRFIQAANFTLKDEYPVPTKENVVSINMPNDMGITAFSNYSAVNFQAGVTYTPNKLELLFARFPNTLTNTDRLVQATKVLEVEFDKNSTFTVLSHLSFHESRSLRKVNIPASVERIRSDSDNNGRAFHNCVSLESITFDEGSNLTVIDNAAFKGCISLKEIQLPESMVTINNNALSYAKGFEIVRLPATFTHFINTNTNGTIRNDHHSFTYLSGSIKEFYLPASFYANAPEAIYKVSYAFDGATLDCKFFYCGTVGEFEIAKANFSAQTAATTNNGGFLNATVITYNEYLANPDAYATGRYVVCEYSPCKAFYNDEHNMSNGVCTRCNETIYCENPEHNLIIDITYESYLSEGTKSTVCLDCGSAPLLVKVPSLFVCKGYSASKTGTNGISLGFEVNKEAIANYTEKTGKTVKYGVFAGAQASLDNNDLFEEGLSDKVIKAEIARTDFACFDIKVLGFTDENMNSKLALGAYVAVTDGEETTYSYMQDGTPENGEKYCFVSYNDLVE
ncbi:MAG: leucine-rich repeat protein [Clostridia bacterium]|nr:leucine-rich repeat protein [Clostridia bacterium]